MTPGLLAVEGVTISAPDGRAVVDALSLHLDRGGRLGIVGESGAGKTTLALAALGVVRPGLRLRAGTVHLAGRDVLALPERARRRLRRGRVAWLGQDPAAALTPTRSVAAQVGELLQRTERRGQAVAHRLAAVGLPTDDGFTGRLPHELSGGQQQRVALARALAADPDLLVLDEPTSRLDPVTRALVVDEVDRLQRDAGFAVLLISHDLDLVARLTDRVLVLRDGRRVEEGATRDVFRAPADPHTGRLLEAQPDPHRAALLGPTTPVDRRGAGERLSVETLGAGFGARRVLSSVDLALHVGETVALVGPSGSGKSTLARCVVGLHAPDAGAVLLGGQRLPPYARDRSRQARRSVQLVGQDPEGALHPRRRVRASVARPLRLLHGRSRARAAAEALDLLREVGLEPRLGDRRPHELSGGERQRVAIARALAARPDVLVCDEITSALDATVAVEILALLSRLRCERGVCVLLITHDLALAASADTVAILDDGRVVESGTAREVLGLRGSLSSRALVAAAPSLSRTLTATAHERTTT